MIVGRMRHNQIFVELRVRGNGGVEVVVEARIDTGYTGELALPSQLIADLQLTQERINEFFLADGTPVRLHEFEAHVLWDNKLRKISVDQIESVPLIGMSLLYNHELRIQVYPGGVVQIKRRRR